MTDESQNPNPSSPLGPLDHEKSSLGSPATGPSVPTTRDPNMEDLFGPSSAGTPHGVARTRASDEVTIAMQFSDLKKRKKDASESGAGSRKTPRPQQDTSAPMASRLRSRSATPSMGDPPAPTAAKRSGKKGLVISSEGTEESEPTMDQLT